MHIGVVTAGVLLILGVPMWASGGWRSLFSASADAVSSASVILDEPSGTYYVLINKAYHQDEENLEKWITFFSGGEILYIFEDAACSAAADDTGGCDLADSYRSRLPENQMQVKREDGTLLSSRIDQGLFDMAVMSKEYADMQKILDRIPASTEVLEVAYLADDADAGSGEETR